MFLLGKAPSPASHQPENQPMKLDFATREFRIDPVAAVLSSRPQAEVASFGPLPRLANACSVRYLSSLGNV